MAVTDCNVSWQIQAPNIPGPRLLALIVKSDIVDRKLNKMVGSSPNFPLMFVYYEPVARDVDDIKRASTKLAGQFIRDYFSKTGVKNESVTNLLPSFKISTTNGEPMML
jgi:hypothetical protein